MPLLSPWIFSSSIVYCLFYMPFSLRLDPSLGRLPRWVWLDWWTDRLDAQPCQYWSARGTCCQTSPACPWSRCSADPLWTMQLVCPSHSLTPSQSSWRPHLGPRPRWPASPDDLQLPGSMLVSWRWRDWYQPTWCLRSRGFRHVCSFQPPPAGSYWSGSGSVAQCPWLRTCAARCPRTSTLRRWWPRPSNWSHLSSRMSHRESAYLFHFSWSSGRD